MGFPFVVSQAQQWVKERVGPGDIVIDATAGNGSDTIFLARTIGPGGSVYAFDIQSEALEQTRKRLLAAADQEALAPVTLIRAGHEEMAQNIALEHRGEIAAVMFNLGYLPGGGSHEIITQPATTLAALETAVRLLRSGGLLTVVVYPGHEGGQAEADAVQSWASEVPPSLGQTIVYRFPQKAAAPYLIALNKR